MRSPTDQSWAVPHSTKIVQKTSTGLGGNWATEKLQRLGYYHPLGPSHLTFPKAQLEATLARLTDCLRVLSCHVQYEDDYLSASCLTMERVRFQVSFFEKDATTLILEIQRRSGDSYIFHRHYARPILAIIRFNKFPDTSQADKERISLSLDRLATSNLTVSNDDITDAIELVSKLVTSERWDACLLGMESLESLTNTLKTGYPVAIRVAREIVVSSTSEMPNKLARVMLHYLLNEKEGEVAFRALHVWANVLQLAATDSEIPLDTFCDTICPADVLLHSLMDRVEQVREHPHEATMALWGLAALHRAMPQLGSDISWQTVRDAEAVGAAQHAALERASRKVLEAR